ncbi:MAG: S8 family serine peptidase, partial [Chloroflexi bacterium]|nr:S8 family serine peptidase [Chloroflexota bacterium]
MKLSLTLVTIALLALLVTIPSAHTTSAQNVSKADLADQESASRGTYIVIMREAPLAMYDGGIAGLAPTSLAATGATKVNAQSAASRAYLAYLAQQRKDTIQAASQLLGRNLDVAYEYGATLVGFATTLTAAEAQLLANLDNIAYVEKETYSFPQTDAGPAWIGAPEIWGGSWEAIKYEAEIIGASEIPPVSSTASAHATFSHNYFTNELSYQIEVQNPDGINFTAMHIHSGATGANGPVIYNFAIASTNATFFSVLGSAILSDVDEANLANGLLYVNAHSTTNPSGEIRGQIELVGSLGEGVIVGVIDTGIDPWNPSFAEMGGDGYIHTNPLGTGEYLGVCDPDNVGGGGVVAFDPTFECNDKLIGVWGYTASNVSPRDTNGHGSHTASTAAGNFVENTVITATIIVTANISGVAPHANIIAYDGCIDGGGCPGAALAASRDQALLDGVDVINYSIGSSAPSSNPWGGAEALQWLALRSAGIFVATSNGNSGPNSATTGSPADLPWIMSVGASTHDRKFLNELIVTDSNGNSISVEGEAIAGGFGPAPIVFAENYTATLVSGATANNARLCGFGAAGSNTSPWTPGTFTGNEIVICERGTYGRVEKGINVAAAGGGAMTLAQPDALGGGPGALASDPHVLPATHIDYYEYQTLLDFIDAAPGGVVTGTLQGAFLARNDSYGDIMASFSSRGPNRAIPDLIVPSITAPGRAIWAAYAQGSGGDGDYTYNVIQGTSMASPHVAGTAALMVALHPDWTPAQVQSALMTTSLGGVYNDDGINPATPFAMGAGRVQVNEAALAGFVLDITEAEYVAANPALGGNPQQLNNASLGDSDCVGVCVWVREIESTLEVASTWVITPELPAGMSMTVEPSSFTLPAGGTQVITFTADATGVTPNTWHFGRVWFTETTPNPYPVVELMKDDGGITATAGTTITYMLHYTNTGDGDAMGVWITETVPAHTSFNATVSSAGWTEVMTDTYTYYIGHLAVGQSGMAYFAVDVDGDITPSVTSIDNMAYITGDDMSVGNASDSTPVIHAGSPVMEFAKSDGDVTAEASDTITYTLTYTNSGDTGATGVWITETVPANTTFNATASSAGWTAVDADTYTYMVGTVADGETGMVYFAVDVDSDIATTVTTIHNMAHIDGDNIAVGTASDSTPVIHAGSPVMEFAKSDGGATAEAGDTITYTLTYTNSGDTGATGVWITETVPANTTFNATASSAGWTAVDADTYTYMVGTVADGETGMVYFAVDVDSDVATTVTTINNMAHIDGDNIAVGTASDSTPVIHAEPLPVIYLPLIFRDATGNSPDTAALALGRGFAGGDVPAIGTSTIGIAPVAHFPLAVSSINCSAPNLIEIETADTIGGEDHLICDETAPVSDLQITLAGLTEGDVYTASLSVDPTNGNPYDNINDGTVTVITVTVSNTARLVAEVYASEAPDIDLFVGTGNTPSVATQACASTGGSFTEYCNINNPADGTWWILVQSWAGSASQPDSIEYTVAVVPNNDVENWTVTAPSVIATGDPLTATIAWEEPSFVNGSRWFGHATFGTDAGHPDNLAEVNVNFFVLAPPPAIAVDPTSLESTQASGTTSNHELDISNIGGGTLNWDIDEEDGFLRPLASADVVESVETVSFVPQAGFGLTGSGLSASAGLTALPAAQRVPNQTITHSTSQTVTAGSISCNSGGLHADNSYWRAFDLPSFGINGAFAISSVDVGVETANGASGSQPVVLRLYAAPSGTAFPAAFPGSFNLIATENVNVANQTLSLLNIPVAAVVPANSVLVMELFTPNGQATNNSFFVGSNAGGQSAPSYIASAPCGITAPTDLAGIGFGNMHIVMNVTGEETVVQTCDSPADIPWLTLNPTSGSAGAGITNIVNVSLDSTGLPAGVYTGTLCVNSNASNAPLVEVPVAMTVTVPTGSSIDMVMTVGTDSAVCAATDDITVASGTEVTYCYEVTNTGAITLTQHDLADTELGT